MMFAATPLFLHLLGSEQYGQWMLLLTFNGFGGLAGIGMGTAATKDVSAARGRGDEAGVAASIRACLMVTILSTMALALLMVTTGWLIGPALLAKMGSPDLVRTIIIVAALLIMLEQIDSVFAGALRGLERFDISAKAEASTKLTLVLVSLAVAWKTGDVVAVFWATIAATIVRLSVKALAVRHFIGQTPWPAFDRPRMAEAFAFGKWTWAQSLGAAMFATADRLIVGSLLGAHALAAYSVCLQLAQQIQTVPAAGAQFLFPAVSRSHAAGESYAPLAIRASLIVGGISLLLALPVALFSHLILSLWVGKDIADAASVTLTLLAAGFAILGLNVGPHFVLLGASRARFVAGINIVAGIVATGCAALAIPSQGLIGAGAAMIVYAVVICVLIFEMRRIFLFNNLDKKQNDEVLY
jgi:O-antigen/teichoic acid export membrane protein